MIFIYIYKSQNWSDLLLIADSVDATVSCYVCTSETHTGCGDPFETGPETSGCVACGKTKFEALGESGLDCFFNIFYTLTAHFNCKDS